MMSLQGVKNIAHFLIAFGAAVWYRFPGRNLVVIGVTGTDGKTTTSTLIYHLLKQAHKKVALVSTVSARIGKEEIDTGFHVTTPEPWALQRLIRNVASVGYEYLVLEVTSHGLDQHRLWGIPFSIGVITNITHEHLDYHKHFDRYVHAKLKLFRHVKYAVLNQDDVSFPILKPRISETVTIYPYSLKGATPSILKALKKRFPEDYNWHNGLAAATAVSLTGVSLQAIIRGIARFPGVKGRMERIPNNKGITTIVDFAHTPNGLKRALTSLVDQEKLKGKSGKLIAVFGSAGLRDTTKRPLMGKVASDLADTIILTAEDPRTEDVNEIIQAIKAGATGTAQVLIEPDRQKAITLAIREIAKSGDTVAVFGKGHEQTMCFGTIEYPWSDHEAITNALHEHSY